MIILNSTSDLVQVVTGSGVSSILVHSSWVDFSAGVTAAPNRTNTPAIVAATTTTIVASPAANTQRNVKTISIYNSSAASDTITVQHTDGTNVITLFKYTLQPAETAMYYEGAASGSAWVVMDANGGLKTSPSSGRLLKLTALTTNIRLRMLGAGGGGGNATGNATQAAPSGGGGAGGYLEKLVATTPNTGYTYTVGAAGAAGAAGTNSTFVVGATTYTASGGAAGTARAVATGPAIIIGGAGGVVSTNGDVNGSGMSGEPGIIGGNAAVIANGSYGAGSGGSTVYGAGGLGSNNAGNGAAAIGFGAGGAGGLSNTASANNGGAGVNGIIIVEEYS
jgi:hypothetical protein